LFPEGTDLTPRTKTRSDKFAQANGFELYEYVDHWSTPLVFSGVYVAESLVFCVVFCTLHF
jgi:hypothetical protein